MIKTPSGKIIPGVQVHANILDNISSGDSIKINNITKIIENIILFVGLIILSIIPKILRANYSIFIFLSYILAILVLSIFLYKINYFIDVFYTTITSTILFTVTIYFRFVEENRLAIENDKKQFVLKQEREIAGEVQKIISHLKEQNDFIFAKNVPARDVSGDYFDCLKINDNEIYFTLADVSGKGVAGMLMLMLLQFLDQWLDLKNQFLQLLDLLTIKLMNLPIKECLSLP